jgi:hypothetical protein
MSIRRALSFIAVSVVLMATGCSSSTSEDEQSVSAPTSSAVEPSENDAAATTVESTAEAPALPSSVEALPRPGADEVAVDPELFRNTGAPGEGFYLTSPSSNVRARSIRRGRPQGRSDAKPSPASHRLLAQAVVTPKTTSTQFDSTTPAPHTRVRRRASTSRTTRPSSNTVRSSPRAKSVASRVKKAFPA